MLVADFLTCPSKEPGPTIACVVEQALPMRSVAKGADEAVTRSGLDSRGRLVSDRLDFPMDYRLTRKGGGGTPMTSLSIESVSS